MTLHVYYKIWLGRLLNEFDITILTTAEQAALRSKSSFQGQLVIAHEGSPTLEIEDEIEPWVHNLCFEGTSRMLAGETFGINYWSRPGSVRIRPEDDSVHLSGDAVPAVTLPLRRLAPALVGAGERFLRWSRGMKSDDPTYLTQLDYIEEFRLPAVEALLAAGIASPRYSEDP